jgi:CBS domain-containing protein
MQFDPVNFTYLSEFLKLPLTSAADRKRIGHIVDLTATTTQVYPKVSGIIARLKSRRERVYVPWAEVHLSPDGSALHFEEEPGRGAPAQASENEILLSKSFLDRQIISTSGNKVVRVNDLHLLIDSTVKENPSVWVVHVDIGFKALLRRLGFLPVASAVFKWVIGRDMKDKFVPWKYVQPTTTAPVSGSLQMETDASRLEEVHPADLADIVQDLGHDEQITLIESFDPSVTAMMFHEMPLRLQLQLSESLELQALAPILTSMHSHDAVDLLDELTPDRRNALLKLVPQERANELRELSSLAKHGVGSIMNPNFITAGPEQTVGDVRKIVQKESRKAELIYYVYVVDGEDHLRGVVSLRQLLAEKPKRRIEEIMNRNVVTVTLETGLRHTGRLFFKYNFDAIPVVDEEGRIQGIVGLRDSLETLFPEVREESGG